MTWTRIVWLGLAAATLAACDRDRDPPPGGGGPVVLKCAVARVVAGTADLVPGPIARGTAGDLVIENDKLRAIVQKGGRNWYNISQFGGNIVDALPKAADGSLVGNDNFEEFVLGTNIESVPNYQSVTVVEAGGENPDGSCKRAVVRATAEFDDLMDFVNGSSAIRGISPLQFPPSADDYDLPFRFETDYILEAGKRYVTLQTRLINQSAQPHRIYLVEYMNGSGEVEVFQSGYGFGEAFATAPCNSCNFVAYAGHEGGAGVSYGLIHNIPTTTTVSVSGVTVLLYGRDILLVATTPEDTQPPRPDSTQPVGPNGPNFLVPANGEITLTRYFAVGDGTVASIVDVRNELVPPSGGTGTLTGVVTDAGGAVAGAEIAVLTSGTEGFPAGRGPSLRVVNHFRTDAQGRFGGTQAAGTYTLRVNVPGRLGATPHQPSVSVSANATTTQNFTVPAASRIQVVVKDGANNPLPAKVQLLGFPVTSDPDPAKNDPDGGEPLNQESVLGGQLVVRSGVFGDALADPLPPRVRLAEFAVLDPLAGPVVLGQTGPLLIEPGTYDVSVSAGPRYSEFRGTATVVAGGLTTVEAALVEVVPTPGYIHGDFHVHSINSPDSEVTNRERVATYLAEGMDFFTPSDHDIRVDFAPVIAAMGVAGAIATAPGAEVTTFDYGHFNFWPVKLETNTPNDELPNEGHSTAAKIGAGATDWGGQAPLGKDFPCAGNSSPCAASHYSLSPWQIFASAALDPFHSGETVVRQINHIDSHFGNAGGSGLAIDTGLPGGPDSTADPAARRLDPGIDNHYSDDYDTLEVLIGTDGITYQNQLLYQQNMGDWFNLLNLGRAKVGISNSDTHQRRVTSLHTRNQVAAPAGLLTAGRANPAAIAADPHAVGDSVRAGLTTMTNAPFLEVTVTEGANTASLLPTRAYGGQGKPLPSDGTVTVNISVQSPFWAPYDQILVFTNGETERHTDQFGQPTSPRRYRICGPGTANTYTLAGGGFTRTVVEAIPGNAASKRYETTQQVDVTTPGGDFWIVVMVRGTQGASPTMWPIVPNNYEDGADNVKENADDTGIRALAISNPIYVDVDAANDTWTAPGVRVNAGNLADRCPQALPAP